MDYVSRIEEAVLKIDSDLVDFSKPRTWRTPPTQVSSEFLTNKEQGDWAEKTLLKAINENSDTYVAVKYGRGDDIVAGEDNFKEFYSQYQDELDEIGKRPDILCFHKSDFPYSTYDISNFDRTILDALVPKAKCGIEVRSSAFLMNKYENFMNEKQTRLSQTARSLRDNIIDNYGDLLNSKDHELYKIVSSICQENLHVISFRCPSWRSTARYSELTNLLKELKQCISEMSKRTFLSITPKVEDLKVVYKWIQTYHVPHFYLQVFFDKAYGISFEKILNLIGSPELEEKEYFIEADIKNQNKTTIKIHANKEECILEKVYLPEHYSDMKELGRGRLLFFVKFKDSVSTINSDAFERLFGFKL